MHRFKQSSKNCVPLQLPSFRESATANHSFLMTSNRVSLAWRIGTSIVFYLLFLAGWLCHLGSALAIRSNVPHLITPFVIKVSTDLLSTACCSCYPALYLCISYLTQFCRTKKTLVVFSFTRVLSLHPQHSRVLSALPYSSL